MIKCEHFQQLVWPALCFHFILVLQFHFKMKCQSNCNSFCLFEGEKIRERESENFANRFESRGYIKKRWFKIDRIDAYS